MSCIIVNLPKVIADFCSPVTNFGQIKKIRLGNQGNPFTDWTLLAEWTQRLDNADETDATKIRTLHGIGGKAKPESSNVPFSLGRSITTSKTHTISFKADEVGDENYALIQFFEDNNGQQVSLWYEIGKYLYGGNDGVTASISVDEVTPENENELQYHEYTITFLGGHPARVLNPMA